MKKILSLLLIYVFFQTQAWALHGGPEFGSTGAVSLVGTYAGTFLPTSASSTNSIGVFALSIPETSVGQGTFVYFQDGNTYTGVVSGVADPSSQTLVGLIEGTYTIVTSQPSPGSQGSTSGVIGGLINGELKANFTQDSINTTLGYTGIRLNGKASMSTVAVNQVTRVVSANQVIVLVDGFQQSATAGSITTIVSTTGS